MSHHQAISTVRKKFKKKENRTRANSNVDGTPQNFEPQVNYSNDQVQTFNLNEAYLQLGGFGLF